MPRSDAPARLVLLLASAGLTLWLALGLSASRHEARGISLASEGRLPGAIAAVRDARAHNHDTRPLVLEAQADIFARRGARALPLLDKVVRREPENLQAWRLIAEVAPAARAAEARRHVAELNPPLN